MSNWLIAIGVTLLIGGVATFYFRTVQLRRDETRAGITALSGVSWRSFIHMVLDALARRGFTRLVDSQNAADDTDYVLERNGEHWLLSCKHGSAFVLGRLTVNELARAIGVKGAAGGFLLTQGRITEDARPVAALQRIELLDGPTLWPQLRDFLPAEQLAAIRARASQLARQRVLASWLFALLAGIAIWLALPEPSPVSSAASAIMSPGTPAEAPAPPEQVAAQDRADAASRSPAEVSERRDPAATAEPVPATSPAAASPSATVAPGVADVPAGSLPIERQRADVAAAISTLPDVDRAVWSSESTLQVILSTIDGDAFTRICPLIERYDELASSRIQLTPPPDSGRSVRFRQCRSY
ncbi:restriction endonuclease [Luteimonas kalidii]|uniref:Restriction endonuclease n=1 Tax=Luteimonas kalidii TaxID=3042025 RepID=A0ABT6JU36_9GAMM|nr:restriction endonuclease [Luteimonas kalidii]MDH5833671.1 restriction endonuclease [Luteimonas kalidii]